MNKEEITILIFIFTLVLFLLVYRFLTLVYTKRLLKAFKNAREFEKLLDSVIVKFLFDPYNREYMRLNFYISQEKSSAVEAQINKLSSVRMNKKQRLTFYKTAIQYYASVNDEKNARKIQKSFHQFADENKLGESMKEAVDMELAIYFTKDISVIPYIDRKLQDCDCMEKAAWNFKKAVVLKANHRLDEAKECMRAAIDCMPDLKQKKALQEMLDDDLKDL